MATKQQKIQALKKQFDDNAARKPKLAIETAVELERLEPGEPRWSHKRGELLQRQGNKEAAVEAYSLAVEKYAGRGFLPRAIAMAKIVLDLDPTRTWVMESLDQSEARQRHRESRVGIDLNDMLSDQKPLDRVAKVLAPAPSNGTDDLRFDDSAPVVLGMSRGELSTVIADAPREESDAGAMPAVPLCQRSPGCLRTTGQRITAGLRGRGGDRSGPGRPLGLALHYRGRRSLGRVGRRRRTGRVGGRGRLRRELSTSGWQAFSNHQGPGPPHHPPDSNLASGGGHSRPR